MTLLLVFTDVTAIIFTLWLIQRILERRKLGPLPPGPSPLPFVGNLLDFPSYKPWETFFRWGQRYGPMVYLNMMGEPVIIINSHEVAADLLDKRSAIYSDRQQLTSAKMIGYTNTSPLVAYGSQLREQRRMVNQTMGTRALVEKYAPLEEQEAHTLLRRIFHNPSSELLLDHIKVYTGAIMLVLTYGYQINNDGKDEMLEKAFESVESFAEATLPGAFLVDVVPILRYVPAWFPWTAWQKKIQLFRHRLHTTMDELFQYTKDQMAQSKVIPNFTSRNLEDPRLTSEIEDILRWAGVAMLGGGIDTTTGIIYALFLAMTLYPEVQRKAHAEIDAVIGRDRLLTFQDRDDLPYINAICTELLRWMPIGPLGVPHLLTRDDEYRGYLFPKGTVCVVNAWGILQDPERYPHPSKFIPERYLGDSGGPIQQDPRNILFGYGRRSCPGIHIADASIYIVVANLIAAFTTEKVVKNGVAVTPIPEQSNGMISHPKPYECNIKPRHADVVHLLHVAE